MEWYCQGEGVVGDVNVYSYWKDCGDSAQTKSRTLKRPRNLTLRFRLRSPKLLFKDKFALVHPIKRRNSIIHQHMDGPRGHYANKTCQICQREGGRMVYRAVVLNPPDAAAL